MRQVSLCLAIRENKGLITEILLAMKKRGFGQGRWNGLGGKIDPEKGDKTVFDSAIREPEEEAKIIPKNLEKVAIIDFHFPEYKKEYNQQVHLFLIREWEGEPEETEEMKPQWFGRGIIPYDEMWDDDKYWLPHILEGKKLKAKFFFDEQDKVVEHKLDLIEILE
jgi:8-oxo-dGTP pyrophosphatase MutT (NUDIX family)